MNPDTDLKQRITGLPDAKLLEMTDKPENYLKDALVYAEDEIERRGGRDVLMQNLAAAARSAETTTTSRVPEAGTNKSVAQGGKGLVISFIVVFFFIGLVFGFVAHLVFPWMIGNMQHAIQTRSFAWNAEQAAGDTTFVMKIMISIIQRSTFEIGLWTAILLGLPFGLLGNAGAYKKPNLPK